MAIPLTGPISIGDFNTILNRASNTADSRLAGASLPLTGSLVWLAGQSGGGLNQTAPFSFSDWYGYEPTNPPTTTTTTTSASFVRIYYDDPYVATRSTRTSTTYTNIASVIVGGTELTTFYAVFWMATGDMSSTSADVRLRLTQDGTQRQLDNMEPQDTTDRMSMGGVYAYGGTASTTWAIQHSGETTNTSGYAGYALLGLELDSTDVYSLSAGSSATANTTYLTKTSVTVPTGTYIIVGSGAIGSDDTAGNPRFRIFDGTNTFGEMTDAYLQDTTGRSPYWHAFRRTVTGSTTFSLQYRGDGSNDGIIREAAMLALDVSKFDNVYYAESLSAVTTTSTTMTNAFSTTFNIANPSHTHLLLASAMLSGSSTASSFGCKLRNTTTSTDYTVEHFREPNQTSEILPTVVARTVTFSGASNTIAWQFDVETGGTTATLRNMTIIVIDLGS